MKKLAILGLGHIGGYVYKTLKNDSKFEVQGFDQTTGHDLLDESTLENIIKDTNGVLASTPYYLNKNIARICNKHGVDYFDLTESVDVTNYVKTLDNACFVTQCGLAPGTVSIIANNLAKQFKIVEDIEIRVGALPIHSNNTLGYYRTWNTEGLINEYIHSCPALVNGELATLDPVTQREHIVIDGKNLEAATTSGGLGSLCESYVGRAKNVNYKTLRYPGHWDTIEFLKNELGMANNFSTYVKLFNDNIPVTRQDVVYILINVTGLDDTGSYRTIKQYCKEIYHTRETTAIQLTTAGGVMAVLEHWALGGLSGQKGWIKQENLFYQNVMASRYADCYR